MIRKTIASAFISLAVLGSFFSGATVAANSIATSMAPIRIAIVSSYHPEYLWSQDTNRGVVAALLKYGYLDGPAQGQQLTNHFYVKTSRAIITKLWMDTKRRSDRTQIENTVTTVMTELSTFKPDIVLLGDDNATNYIGNQFIDTDTPVVFWGVNGHPLKYDLADSIERPGHNVTGIYQAGYLREGIESLKNLLPSIEAIAVLSDDSPSGRSKAKALTRLARQGKLPLKVIEVVTTNSYVEWKAKALELAGRVDAFCLLNHNTLKDEAGNAVDQLEAGAWYLRNIKKPEVSHERQFVVEGLLAAVDDSGYQQGFEAIRVAHRILSGQAIPATTPMYAPKQGPFVVNLERARMLGIEELVRNHPLVEERIDRALALKTH